MTIDIPDSRRQTTLKMLEGDLGQLVLLWRRLIKNGLYKQAKVTCRDIHKVIKKHDLVTTLVFSFPLSDNQMTEKSKDK